MVRAGIVGTTSWGTTLGVILAHKGIEVRLWARTKEDASRLCTEGENRRFLPGVPFPQGLSVTSSSDEALSDADVVIIAVPSRSLRQNIQRVRHSLSSGTVIVSAVKGLEMDTCKRMSEVLEEELPPDLHSSICVLSGPNLASEIIQGKPSSTVIASRSADAAARAQDIITTPMFRVYTNDDTVGVELGGALKNIIALGAGICDGLEYGDNAKAAFITRGLAEIARLGVAAGANPLTLAGLAGMGDLIATCSSRHSRNHYVGEQLARGKTLEEVRASMHNVAEGVDTTAPAIVLAQRLGVEMPITQATYNVLFKGVPLEQAIAELLGRTPKPE